MARGRKPIGKSAMTSAQRQQRHRAKKSALTAPTGSAADECWHFTTDDDIRKALPTAEDLKRWFGIS